MTPNYLKVTVPFLFASCAGVALVLSMQIASAARPCSDVLQETQIIFQTHTAGAEAMAQKSETVTVETTKGDVEVPAADAQPTENWFGNPPTVETVRAALEAAETARAEGDEEACLAQVKDARVAMGLSDQ